MIIIFNVNVYVVLETEIFKSEIKVYLHIRHIAINNRRIITDGFDEKAAKSVRFAEVDDEPTAIFCRVGRVENSDSAGRVQVIGHVFHRSARGFTGKKKRLDSRNFRGYKDLQSYFGFLGIWLQLIFFRKKMKTTFSVLQRLLNCEFSFFSFSIFG